MRLLLPPSRVLPVLLRALVVLAGCGAAGCPWFAVTSCPDEPFAFDETLREEAAARLAEEAGGELADVPCVEACAELLWSGDPADIHALDACTVEVVDAYPYDGDTGAPAPASLHVTCSGEANPGCK